MTRESQAMNLYGELILQLLTAEPLGIKELTPVKAIPREECYEFITLFLEEIQRSGMSDLEQAKRFDAVRPRLASLSPTEMQLLAKSIRKCAPALKNSVLACLTPDCFYLTMDEAHILEYSLIESWGPGWVYQEGRWFLTKGSLTLEVRYQTSAYPKTMTFMMVTPKGPSLTLQRVVSDSLTEIYTISEEFREFVYQSHAFVVGTLP